MTSRVVLILSLLIGSVPAMAQSDTTFAKPSWFMTAKGGVLFARQAIETAPSVSMTQGIRYDRFALSVGVAYDAYKHWRTLPVFTGLSYDLIQGSGYALYVQMEAGYSKAWYRQSQEAQSGMGEAGGYVYHPALGYRGGLGKVQIHVSMGYKIQNIGWHATQWGRGGWNPTRVTIEQQIERLSLLIGIGLR